MPGNRSECLRIGVHDRLGDKLIQERDGRHDLRCQTLVHCTSRSCRGFGVSHIGLSALGL